MIPYTLFILHCFTSFVNKIQDMFVVYGSFSEFPNPILWRPAVGNIGDWSSWITMELAFYFFNFLLVDRLIYVVSFQNIRGYLRLVLSYLVIILGVPSSKPPHKTSNGIMKVLLLIALYFLSLNNEHPYRIFC